MPDDSIDLSRRAQSFFALADGADRVRSCAEVAAAQGVRFRQHRGLRHDLIDSIADYRHEQSQVLIGDFQTATFQATRRLLSALRRRIAGRQGPRPGFRALPVAQAPASTSAFPGVHIAVPPTLVIATDLFRPVHQREQVARFRLHCADDSDIESALPGGASAFRLAAITCWRSCRRSVIRWRCARPACWKIRITSHSPACTKRSCWPIASTILRTGSSSVMEAIKRVYASTFSQQPSATCGLRHSGWKKKRWRCILQQVVGADLGSATIPIFPASRARGISIPCSPMQSADGIATVALGLGREVVDGGKALSFCPQYPRQLIQFSSVEDILANSQAEFWALELDPDAPHPAGRRWPARSQVWARCRRKRRHFAPDRRQPTPPTIRRCMTA